MLKAFQFKDDFDPDIPGLIRETLYQIEANVDDLSPQISAHVMERVLKLGAKDAWIVQGIMKKGRPAQILHVLSQENHLNPLVGVILKETTTLGVRVVPCNRYSLQREMVKVDTRYGPITLKLGYVNNKVLNVMPEYEECAVIALKYGKSIKLIIDVAKAAWYEKNPEASM